MKIKNKRGEILVGNVIFIILNVIYLLILVLFIYNQGSGVILLEEVYAKQITLLIDSAQPGMFFYLNMEKAFEVAEKNNVNFTDIVIKNDNVITIKLKDPQNRAGYSYSFFNDVDVTITPIKDEKMYLFSIEAK